MSTARIDELRSKFEENPRRYFAPLANEYRKAGDLSQAIALCREHLPKQPGHMSGHIVFGQALYEAGEFSEAQTVFQAALDLDPENLIALRHLGDIARSRGDDPLARRWYERVLDADPRNNDIAALLSTLAARLTPQAMTPVSSPAVLADSPPQELDARSVADADDDPFSAPDSPAWHTPPFLTPLASPVVVPGAMDAASALHNSDAMHGQGAADAQNSASAATAANAADAYASNASTHASDDLLDLDFSSDADAQVTASSAAPVEPIADEWSAESGQGLVADVRASDTGLEEMSDAWAMEGAPEDTSVAGASVNNDDLLSAALGAFASNNLEDTETEDALDSANVVGGSLEADTWPIDDAYATNRMDALIDVTDDDVELGIPLPASFDDGDDFEEGLVAQEWPDTAALTARVPTPAHSALPIVPVTAEESVAETDDTAEESVAETDDTGEVPAAHASDISLEADAMQADADVLVSLDDTVPVGDDLLEVIDIGEEDSAERAADIVSVLDAERGVVGAATLDAETVEAVEADESVDAVEAVASVDAVVAVDDGAVVEVEDVDDVEAAQFAALDEDPPASATDIPWLSSPEVEREAEDFLTMEETAFVAAESVDNAALADEAFANEAAANEAFANQAAANEAAENESIDDEHEEHPAAAPAFVTETMAELLVAQGFVARAVEVYEELVIRRPYDAVLTSRLQELRGMLAAEQVAEEAPQDAPQHARQDAPQDAALADAPAPAPVAAVHEESPHASLLAQATFPAPPRRSAREMFAALAAMRAARRTPAYGAATVAATVSMPTPADGLASLFGESPILGDDLTSRAMARAFGSGEGVTAGPSMFTPSHDADAQRGRPTPAAVPPVPSGPAFSFDRFFPDPATTSNAGKASDTAGASQATESAVASGSGEAPAADPSSAGADLAHFSQWLKGLSNS